MTACSKILLERAPENKVNSVHFADLGGLRFVKRTLRELYLSSSLHVSTLGKLGIVSSHSGVLLYGPPGCSKTMLARAIATESSVSFIAVSGPELLSMWLGDSERAIRAIFSRAASESPSVIFFDEIDALAFRRSNSALARESPATDRVLAQLLVELDGITTDSRCCIVAASNRPDLLDPALMRPGRIDYLLYISPPDLSGRCEILTAALQKMPLAKLFSNSIILQLSRCTTLCSGAEIIDVCRRAALRAVEDVADRERSKVSLTLCHVFGALTQLEIAGRSESLVFYEAWQQRGVS